MSYRTKDYERLVPLICRLPVGTYYEVSTGGLFVQAKTQKKLLEVQAAFPELNWTMSFDTELKWWEYTSELEGTRIKIYACREAPVIEEVVG